ncbi:hypothetical protein PcaKH35_17910 [Parageobacillus caldoxylosilyticus]|nr:hypothetical protein PcaKH35_17910 [Parageobacillus caldoxylosilyticus]
MRFTLLHMRGYSFTKIISGMKRLRINMIIWAFPATDDGFYSSGHPEEGSSLGNPLGLVKSFDNGQTLMNLGFYKESDFHYMTVGYKSHTIYVVNHEENKTLGQGLFYSKDDGKKWLQSQLNGLPQTAAGTIAAHPTDENMVGISRLKEFSFQKIMEIRLNGLLERSIRRRLSSKKNPFYLLL